MNIFSEFPWSDTTRYNLNWVIRTVKALEAKVKELAGKIEITVDTAISPDSSNPVENRAIYTYVEKKFENISTIDGEVF